MELRPNLSLRVEHRKGTRVELLLKLSPIAATMQHLSILREYHKVPYDRKLWNGVRDWRLLAQKRQN